MKIAVLGSALYQSPVTPGKIYAPLKIQYELAMALQRRGHTVTFFGQADEETTAPFPIERLGFPAIWKKTLSFKKPFQAGFETLFRTAAYKEALQAGFDIIQDHNLYWSLPESFNAGIQVVVTIHDSTSLDDYARTYSQYRQLGGKGSHIAAVSQHMAKQLGSVGDVAVARNGVNIRKIPFNGTPGSYLVWIGRVAPSKGLHHAIEVAKKVGLPLKFAGPTGPFKTLEAEDYYEREIKPHIDGAQVEYMGVLSQEEAYQLFAGAYAYIFPSNGMEGMPMTVLESMAAGTPVLATRKGPLPELVRDGVNGFLYDDYNDLWEGVARIREIDRHACRRYAEQHFSLEAMAQGYEALYWSLLSGDGKGAHGNTSN